MSSVDISSCLNHLEVSKVRPKIGAPVHAATSAMTCLASLFGSMAFYSKERLEESVIDAFGFDGEPFVCNIS